MREFYRVSGTEAAMKMKPDQERVKTLLTDTVTLLCKNGLQYSKELKVQGLLGITLDNDEVFVVHINEIFNGLLGAQVSALRPEETTTSAIAAADSATSDVPVKSRKGIPQKYENSSPSGSSKRKAHTPSPLIVKKEQRNEEELVMLDAKSIDSDEFCDDIGEGDREAMRKSYGEMLDPPPAKRRVADSSGSFREKPGSFIGELAQEAKDKHDESDTALDNSSLDDSTGLDNLTADGQSMYENSAGCSNWEGQGTGTTQSETGQDSVAPPPHSLMTAGIRMRLPTMVPSNSIIDAMQPFRRPRYSFKPFECPEPSCGRKFYHRGDVYRHQRINHGAGHIGKPHTTRTKRSRPSYYQEHLQAQLELTDLSNSNSMPEFPIPITQDLMTSHDPPLDESSSDNT